MRHSFKFFLPLYFLSLISIPTFVLAAPIYNPGETLNPSCLPSDPDCAISNTWDRSGLNAYFNLGNIGIGTTTFSNRFQISGSSFFGGNITATGTLRLLPLSSTVLAVDQNGTIIATTTGSGGSGAVSSGITGQNAYYAANGTTVVGT